MTLPNIDTLYPGQAGGGGTNLTTANTNRTVSGVTGLTSVGTVGANGGLLYLFRVEACGNTTAGAAGRIWLYNTTNYGTNALLLDEITIPAITVGSTQGPFAQNNTYSIALPANTQILVSSNTTDSINYFVAWGNY